MATDTASRAPFKSGTSDYIAIRKRMEELGLIKPAEGEKNGVDITPPVEPNAPITPPSTYYGGYYDREKADSYCGG